MFAKKFVDSEFEIGEIFWWICYKSLTPICLISHRGDCKKWFYFSKEYYSIEPASSLQNNRFRSTILRSKISKQLLKNRSECLNCQGSVNHAQYTVQTD